MTAVPYRGELVTVRSRLSHSMWATAVRRVLRNPQGLIAVCGLALLVVAAAGAGVISWHDPIAQDASRRLLPPSWDHPFGTDELRRDLFARTLFGLRTSLALSVLSVVAGAAVGITAGFCAGYARGWVESIVMRIIDALLAFPGLLTVLAIVTILGRGSQNVGIAIAIFTIPGFVRLSRAQMLAERNKDYVVAARVLGATPQRIIFRHIALNALPPLLTQVALATAGGVLLVASLSFLGLGERPPAPSLGGLINASKTQLQDAWWYPLFPGAVLALLLLSLNLLADAVNEAISPHAQRRS